MNWQNNYKKWIDKTILKMNWQNNFKKCDMLTDIKMLRC